MQSNLRLWYRTLIGAPRDINRRLHFPYLFVSLASEILKYVINNSDTYTTQIILFEKCKIYNHVKPSDSTSTRYCYLYLTINYCDILLL